MNYLIDTDVISALIAGRPKRRVVEWLDNLDPDAVFLSVLTTGEIRKGIDRLPPSRRKDEVRSWLETDLLFRFQGRILTITTAVMLVWGKLTARLESSGTALAVVDSLVAAIALERDCCLVTRNEHDFEHTGVRIINPWKDV